MPDSQLTEWTIRRDNATLGMMAKHWTPGRVKTRLGKSIGDRIATELHRLFCVHLCDSLAEFPGTKQVVFDPPDKMGAAEDQLGRRRLGTDSSWQVVAQSSGDLGDRMSNWFESLTADETAEDAVAILIGADCPTVTMHSIQRATQHLLRNDLVLGPALDGGYYLIGMRLSSFDRMAGLFANIPWSTEHVFSSTLRAANRSGLKIGLLEPKEDVDTVEDLARLRDRLRSSSRAELNRLEQQLHAVLGETGMASPRSMDEDVPPEDGTPDIDELNLY